MEPAARQTAVPDPVRPDPAQRVFGVRVELAARYVAHLADTGVSHGLIGPRERPRLWERHVLNCAVVGELIPQGAAVADVGSGAGLPGIALAIARPDLRITLVEPLLRRVTWLEDTVGDLGLAGVRIRRARAEQLWDELEVDVVTSRAVARLEELAQWSLPLLRADGTMLAVKGASAAEELEAARQGLTEQGVATSDIVPCGVGRLEQPTTVVRLRLGGRARRLPDAQPRTKPAGRRRARNRQPQSRSR